MTERFEEKPGVRHSDRKRGPAAADGRTTEQDPVLDLQRQAGNRAVSEMLQGGANGPAGASPALRLRDALRARHGVVQRELSLNVQRDLKSDTEEKEDPAEASAEKLGGEEKMPSGGEEKMPGGEEKMPSGGEEKMPSDSTDKFPGDEEKGFDDEEKFL
jgi:hypothetical protein